MRASFSLSVFSVKKYEDIRQLLPYTVSAGFNEFVFNESSRFKESIFDFKYFFLHNNFGFFEFPGLTKNWLGHNRFGKSGRHGTW